MSTSEEMLSAIREFPALAARVKANTENARALRAAANDAPQAVKDAAIAAQNAARRADTKFGNYREEMRQVVRDAKAQGLLTAEDLQDLKPSGLGAIPLIALGVAAVLAGIATATVLAAYRATAEDAARAEAVTAQAAASLADWQRRSSGSAAPVPLPNVPGNSSFSSAVARVAGGTAGVLLVGAIVLGFWLLSRKGAK